MKTNYETDSEQYVIFASHQPCDRVTAGLLALGIVATPVDGCYKGKEEQAYLVDRKHWERGVRRNTTIVWGQESALHLGPRDESKGARPAYLQYLEIPAGRRVDLRAGGLSASIPSPKWLGWFCQSSKEDALKQDGWTLLNGRYYVVREA